MQYVVKHGNLLLSKSGKLVKDVNEAYIFPTRAEARTNAQDLNSTGTRVKVYKLALNQVSYERS